MNALSVCFFEAPGFHSQATSFHLTKTSLPYLWQTEGVVKYQFHIASSGERGAPCVRVGGKCLKGVKNRTKGQSVRAKPQASWAEMACTVSAASRAAPHIRACLHSAGLLQSLTAGKTSPLLWARSQEKATSASLSQRERYSDHLSPTAAESQQQVG